MMSKNAMPLMTVDADCERQLLSTIQTYMYIADIKQNLIDCWLVVFIIVKDH